MAQSSDDTSQLRARIWWALWVDPGDRTVGELIERYGVVGAARKAQSFSRALGHKRAGRVTREHAELASVVRRYPQMPTRTRVDGVIELCERRGIHITLPGEGQWPSALGDLGPHQPLALFSRGRLEIIETPENLVSVVGTRRPSVVGASAARDICETLADRDITIVSGGALGIDAIAHRTALKAGAPTVVVTATGVDRDYPREHSALFDTVAATGLLVSETPPGKSISPTSFLARNRLIAALSRATIVVECPVRSGALSTASHAATLGRALYSVTYPFDSPQHAGNDRLIEEWGADPLRYSGQQMGAAGGELFSFSRAV